MLLFFGAKISSILTFILTNSIKAIKWRQRVKSVSYLITQPRPLSPLQWSNLTILQLTLRYYLFYLFIFSVKLSPPPTVPFHWVSSFQVVFFFSNQSPTQYLLTGWEFLRVFQPSSTHCFDHEYALDIFPNPHPPPPPTHPTPHQYLSNWEWAGNPLHCQIKLRISTNTGD